jgi:hypothetical protein
MTTTLNCVGKWIDGHIQFHVIAPLQWALLEIDSFRITITDTYRWSEDTIEVFLKQCGKTIRFEHSKWLFELLFETSEAKKRLFCDCLPRLIDLVAALSISDIPFDVLWIDHIPDRKSAWILSITFDGAVGQGMCIERDLSSKTSRLMQLEGWLLSSGSKTRNLAQAAFTFLTDPDGLALPLEFPLLRPARDDAKGGILVICFSDSYPWPFLIPFDHFKHYPGYGRLSSYKDVGWLTTDRSFVEELKNRNNLILELQNPTSLVKHSVFIVNHSYEHFGSYANDVNTALTLVRRIFAKMQNLDVDGEESLISLRLCEDPEPQDVWKLLSDVRMKYLFADFHVADGDWLTGKEGKRVNLHRLSPGTLRHIRLLHIYHCGSVAATYSISRSPDICALLLRAGVERVSGSPARESFCDYVCSLLKILCDSRGLGVFLLAKVLENPGDSEDLIASVNQFLRKYDYAPVNSYPSST